MIDLNWMFGAPPANSREPIRVRKLSAKQTKAMWDVIHNGGVSLGASRQALAQAGYSDSDIASYFEAAKNA